MTEKPKFKKLPKNDLVLGYGRGLFPYSVCLTLSNATADSLIDMAKMHYADMAKGFCISKKHPPYVSLSNFYANDISALPTRLSEMKAPSEVKLSMGQIRRGRFDHEGYDWVEFTVENSAELAKYKAKIDEMLEFFDIKRRTPNSGEEYYPHIALARVSAGTKVAVPVSEHNVLNCKLTLARTDNIGQLVKLEQPVK